MVRICYSKTMIRKKPLVNGEIYHVFSRSIANYIIFNNNNEYDRMFLLLKYYQVKSEIRFSDFLELKSVQAFGFNSIFETMFKDNDKLVQIIAYCLMPTHIHLVLKQLIDVGISDFMQKTLNSYSTYFNLMHKRKGPLWESRFKSVLVESDDQLNHLVRYFHLNPTTADLVKRPEDWLYSSYREYLGEVDNNQAICQYNDVLDINQPLYRKFVNDQISYQRELAKIKKLIMD